jgi:hypothetical protein
VTQAQARQRQHLVADPADPVFGLPWLAALDARARLQHVVPCMTDQVVTARRRIRRGLDRFTEGGSPVGAAWAELGRRREGDVDLQATRQQEHPVHGRAPGQVPVMERTEVRVEQLRPPLESLGQLAVDRQRQVDVGPLVSPADGVRARDRGGHNARIGLRELEQALPYRSRSPMVNIAPLYRPARTATDPPKPGHATGGLQGQRRGPART